MAMKNKEQNPVMVDIGKLNAGLAAVFHDIGTVFEAIGVEAPAVAAVMGTVPDADSVTDASRKEKGSAPDAAAQASAGRAEEAADAKTGTDGNTAEAPVQALQEQTVSPGAEGSAEPSITYDELTEIIVKKIEKDRSVSDKVRELLNGKYGVEKAKFLPKTKYEEFLTDLSAL